MKTWQKILIPVLLAILVAGARLYFVFRERQDPGIAGKAAPAPKLTMDQLAVIRKKYFASFDDAKDLEGATVWVKAGFSLPYYPYSGSQIEFAKHPGVLPSAEKLAVTKLIKAVTPAKEDNRIPHGSKQYFIVFPLAGQDGLFAAPIGYAEGASETIFADQLFYYDDPRKIYDNWPAPVWEAVATHTPTLGMNENQVRMAVGVLQPANSASSSTEGDRTVTYIAGPKSWTITFQKGVATAVKPG